MLKSIMNPGICAGNLHHFAHLILENMADSCSMMRDRDSKRNRLWRE